jgi:hypothetical protein
MWIDMLNSYVCEKEILHLNITGPLLYLGAPIFEKEERKRSPKTSLVVVTIRGCVAFTNGVCDSSSRSLAYFR